MRHAAKECRTKEWQKKDSTLPRKGLGKGNFQLDNFRLFSINEGCGRTSQKHTPHPFLQYQATQAFPTAPRGVSFPKQFMYV